MKILNSLEAMSLDKTLGREPASQLATLTVPNQAEDLKNILRRFANGQPLPIGRQIYHDGLDDFDQIDETLNPDFDLSDMTKLQESVKENAERKQQLEEKVKLLNIEKEKQKKLNISPTKEANTERQRNDTDAPKVED